MSILTDKNSFLKKSFYWREKTTIISMMSLLVELKLALNIIKPWSGQT
jgi:hypothetical protein